MYYTEYACDRMMSEKPGAKNIWESTVLQLAESDELVMNAVLAAGSVHLAASMSNNQAIEEATTRYVLHSITGLQLALKDWDGSSSAVSDDTIRLMLVTCLLAEHEVRPRAPISLFCYAGLVVPPTLSSFVSYLAQWICLL
jgi:hypothetical protein